MIAAAATAAGGGTDSAAGGEVACHLPAVAAAGPPASAWHASRRVHWPCVTSTGAVVRGPTVAPCEPMQTLTERTPPTGVDPSVDETATRGLADGELGCRRPRPRVPSTRGEHRLTTLPGGERVITERVDGVRSASIGLWIGAGSRDETRAGPASRTSSSTCCSRAPSATAPSRSPSCSTRWEAS